MTTLLSLHRAVLQKDLEGFSKRFRANDFGAIACSRYKVEREPKRVTRKNVFGRNIGRRVGLRTFCGERLPDLVDPYLRVFTCA